MRLSLPLAFLGCCLAAAPSLTLAQDAKPAGPPVGSAVPPAQVYDKLLSGMEKEFVDAAEAMPEDKYNFAPPASAGEFKGVRTFADQIKHVAEANEYFFHDPAAPLADTRDEIAKLKTKAEIVARLKASFAIAHAYIAAITPENAFIMTKNGTRAGQAAFGLAHFMDHYGQLVEYLRMNGIVPPASRGGGM
jgi:hypothetical protein